MQGAEERRLRRTGATALLGREGNEADDVLMVDQSLAKIFDTRVLFSYSHRVERGIFLSHKTLSQIVNVSLSGGGVHQSSNTDSPNHYIIERQEKTKDGIQKTGDRIQQMR